MKLRIKGNSIRLRLQRSELAKLKETGRVSEVLTIGPSLEDAFEYGIETSTGDAVQLRRHYGALTVVLPEAWALTLASTDRVGYDVSVPTAPGMEVRVIIEKDFQCLVERPGEDESDTFPNPDSSGCAPR